MIASLSAQFSDVELRSSIQMLTDSVPPFPTTAAGEALQRTRVRQTIWCCVEATNLGVADAYLLIRPFSQMPMPEYRGGPLASVVKRRDIPGAPSPLGTCISEMLGDIWRFLVLAGETRRYSFFVPSDGMFLQSAAWATDLAGVVIPVVGAITGRFWSSVGSSHAITSSPTKEDSK